MYVANRRRAPSASRLCRALNIAREDALRIRALIKGAADPESYDTARDWVRQCYHRPRRMELIMTACNEVAGTTGVEYAEEVRTHYLNSGDIYAPTLVYRENTGTFDIRCIADLIP